MTNPTPAFTRPGSTPGLRDVLNLLKKEILLQLNCHAVATVQTFDSDSQTVTAIVNYKKSNLVKNEETGLYSAVLMDYPVLLDVPVIIMGGGGFSLTFPISLGDECLILFNDRDIDNWFQGNSSQSPASARLHSFSDGIALVGLNSSPNVYSNYDTTHAIMKSASGAELGIGETLIRIANNGTTLNTLLQDLIAAISGLSIDLSGVTAGSDVVPGGGSIDATSQSTLSTIAQEIGELLE